MKATQQLHDLGQSLWLDNITRGLLTSGTLHHYINEFAVTGLTSNPTIFEHAIKDTDFYDEAIHQKAGADNTALAAELQREGTAAFARSWRDLMQHITSKAEVLTQTHPGRVTS